MPPAPPTDSHHDDRRPVIQTTGPQDRESAGRERSLRSRPGAERAPPHWAENPSAVLASSARSRAARPETETIDRLGLHDQQTGTPGGPSSPADPAARGGRERQRSDDLPPPRHQPAGLVHPSAPRPRGSIDNDCRHAHSTQRQSPDHNARQTHAVITIRDHPTRRRRTGQAATRLRVMPHQPQRPGPPS
jgi:hypothetical protein